MKVMLIFPPQAAPFMPHLATPLLCAALQRAGIEVVQRDFNIEAYRWYLGREQLAVHGISCDAAEATVTATARLCAPVERYVRRDYRDSLHRVEQALRVISSQYGGSSWGIRNYSAGAYCDSSSRQVRAVLEDAQRNVFLRFFEHKLADIADEKPDILGLSIAWSTQIIPALTLARLVKTRLPTTHVTVGGSLVTHLDGAFAGSAALEGVVDSVVSGEGETSLLDLVAQARKGGPLTRPHRSRGTSGTTRPSHAEHSVDLPAPSFAGLPLDSYLSRALCLPLQASRGCYWARCAFCSHYASQIGFRPRPAERVFDDMMQLWTITGATRFYFVDDAMPPSTALGLCQVVAAAHAPFTWQAEMRLEPHLTRDFMNSLYAGGCRVLEFGLESASQRVLDSMRKGTSVATAQRVIRAASEAGIITKVFFMLGFPGETEDDWSRTLAFFEENAEWIDTLSGGPFVLARHAPAYREPASANIRSVETRPDWDWQLTFDHMPESGLSPKDASRLLTAFRVGRVGQRYVATFVAESHLLLFDKSQMRTVE